MQKAKSKLTNEERKLWRVMMRSNCECVMLQPQPPATVALYPTPYYHFSLLPLTTIRVSESSKKKVKFSQSDCPTAEVSSEVRVPNVCLFFFFFFFSSLSLPLLSPFFFGFLSHKLHSFFVCLFVFWWNTKFY